MIESCILATDLSLHFRHLPEMSKLANLAPNIVIDSVVFGNDAKAAHNRFILQASFDFKTFFCTKSVIHYLCKASVVNLTYTL